MQKVRSAGVLLHLTSLPGPFGVGVMGKEAETFVLQLERMGFHYWQVLPLCPVDDTGSPYCSCSANAGNLALIDPRQLMAEGLLSEQEVRGSVYPGSIYVADYQFALQQRLHLLRLAFSRLTADDKDQIALFARQNAWVNDYALYAALKDKNNGKSWWEWPKTEAVFETAKQCAAPLQREVSFHTFCQFVFFKQYRSLKAFANAHGVFLIGDMPIYVSRDSVDVWSNLRLFQINKRTLAPKKVAGVPPDYFSADGQLWGNPLYDWAAMKADGYRWWVARVAHASKLFDRVRIDHFRAFASYWAVPFESETAKVGAWQKGPGMDLFRTIQAALPDADIIAEDLGVFGEDVVRLLRDTGFPGMRVVQFGFDPNGDSTHLPHNYPKNCVAYLGTHDNNTLLGWLWDADEAERAFALRYCCFGGRAWGEGGYHSGSCRALIETVWKSAADTAVITVQDMCGYGKDARMNTPGTSEDNWKFRISADALAGLDEEYYKEINTLYRRYYSPERTDAT